MIVRTEARRDVALTTLLVVQCVLLFLGAPLAVSGDAALLVAADALILVYGVLIVVIARGRIATVAAGVIVGGMLVASVFNVAFPSSLTRTLAHMGSIFVLVVVGYAVARAVFAPGPVSAHRLLGAIVLYLNVGLFFSTVFRLIHDRIPQAFSGISADASGPEAFAALIYFSFVTLTSTGFGDITPTHPLVRSIVNVEGVVGQLYPATLLARLLTLYMEARRR